MRVRSNGHKKRVDTSTCLNVNSKYDGLFQNTDYLLAEYKYYALFSIRYCTRSRDISYFMFKVLRPSGLIEEISTNSVSIRKINLFFGCLWNSY